MPRFDGRSYQTRFDTLAAQGVDVHGEAALVHSLHPGSVLDAGCGTGRVAIELARRGIRVVGVDIDASMLGEARRQAPDLEWVEADLASLSLGRTFDVVVLAGNVPLFCPSPARFDLVLASASHLADGGALVAGFQIDRDYRLVDYDTACLAAGLVLVDRWATWDRQPFTDDARYAVSVHRVDA
jgi:SAM-dependent methyltransferase